MTLTTEQRVYSRICTFQMPVRSMTLTTAKLTYVFRWFVSDACQINDFDHRLAVMSWPWLVSDACQINDFDHSCHVSPYA